MSGTEKAGDRLFFECHDMRLMVSGCLFLVEDFLNGMRTPSDRTDKIEIIAALLKATQKQAITVLNISEEVANATNEAPAGA